MKTKNIFLGLSLVIITAMTAVNVANAQSIGSDDPSCKSTTKCSPGNGLNYGTKTSYLWPNICCGIATVELGQKKK